MTNEELIKNYRSGDVFALDKLCEANSGLISFIAHKYYGLDDLNDLIQTGWEGFLKAVDTYNPDKENSAKFSTWAVYYIKGHIMRYLDQNQQHRDAKSLNEPLDDDSETTLQDTLPDEDAELAAFRHAERRELRQELENVMRECLPLRQREIVKLRVAWEGYGEPWTYEDIAKAHSLATGQGAVWNFKKAIWRILRSRWGREQIRMIKAEKIGHMRYDTEATALERLEWAGY